MGHKIFISYKYSDSNVKQISSNLNYWEHDTVRTYVDALEQYIQNSEHIYKGESDGEDLSSLSDDAIWEKLKDRIYDSSLTLVLISANMKEDKRDRDQWIPWEISYSLKEVSRRNESGNMVKSASNAIISIVIPDRNGSYDYFITHPNCCRDQCRMLDTSKLFRILKNNMFNKKNPDKKDCYSGKTIYYGECSYILSVAWNDFILNPEKYIQRAYKIQNSIEQYDMEKEMID